MNKRIVRGLALLLALTLGAVLVAAGQIQGSPRTAATGAAPIVGEHAVVLPSTKADAGAGAHLRRAIEAASLPESPPDEPVFLPSTKAAIPLRAP